LTNIHTWAQTEQIVGAEGSSVRPFMFPVTQKKLKVLSLPFIIHKHSHTSQCNACKVSRSLTYWQQLPLLSLHIFVPYAKYFFYLMCSNISSAFLHLNMCLKRHHRLTETFSWSPCQQMSYSPLLLEAVYLIWVCMKIWI